MKTFELIHIYEDALYQSLSSDKEFNQLCQNYGKNLRQNAACPLVLFDSINTKKTTLTKDQKGLVFVQSVKVITSNSNHDKSHKIAALVEKHIANLSEKLMNHSVIIEGVEWYIDMNIDGKHFINQARYLITIKEK